jgi:hypothetical protein
MKIKLRAFLLFIFFLPLAITSTDALAQKVDSLQSDRLEKSDGFHYKIGFTPTALSNFYPALQLSHELSYNRFLFNIETGYIFESSIYQQDFVSGMRLRPSIGYKLVDFESNYGGFELFYNYRYTKIDRELEVSRANGAYTEFVRGNLKNTMQGWGMQYRHAFIMDKFTIKAGAGFGLMDIFIRYSNDELADQVRDSFLYGFFNRPGHHEFLATFVTMSVLYQIK